MPRSLGQIMHNVSDIATDPSPTRQSCTPLQQAPPMRHTRDPQRAPAPSIARTIRISRTSSSIFTTPSVTKSCFR